MAESTALSTDASPNTGESAPERRPVVRASRSARRWATVHASTRRRREPRRPAQAPVLQVADLTVQATDGSVILDEVSFSVPRGSVVAIVGPTGAGKTTLLNALTGRLRVQHGSIRVNGEELADNDALRRRLGYVPQDDVLHPQLTLRQTLEHAAALRLPSHVDAHHRAERVTAVLTEVGLEEREHLPISSLSGGQRKRASVAVELLSQPEVLVLDEPTTGLDPGRERSVLASLRSLADLGHTVLTVTHSPQALAECDRVLFLAGGHVAFFGSPAAAIDYFGHADAAEVFLALATTPGEDWKERFRAHPLHARSVPRRPAAARVLHSVGNQPEEQAHPVPTPPGWAAQFRTLVRRCLDVMRSDRRHMVLLALQGPVLGLLLASTLIRNSFRPLVGHVAAALSSQHRLDAISASLFVALSITWLGTANAVREIVKEKRTLLREEGTGLSLPAYVSAKVVALGAVAMLQSAILAVVATMHQGVPAHGAVLPSGVLELAVVGALAGLCAIAIGLMLSALVTSADKALTVLPVSLVAQLVFSGAWVPLNGPLFRQLRDLSSLHWAVHAMRATTIHDRGDWWLSVFALLVITGSAIFATLALVQRRVLPTQIGETTARLGFRMQAGMRPAAIAAGGLLLVLAVTSVAATTSDFVPRAKLLGVLHHKSASANTQAPQTAPDAVVRLTTDVSPLPVDIAPPQVTNVPDAPAGLAALSRTNETAPSQPAGADAATVPSAPAADAPAANPSPPAGLSPGPGAPAAPTTAPPASSTSTDTSASDAAARQAMWQQWMEYAVANQNRRSTTSTTTPPPSSTSTTMPKTTSTTTRRYRG